MVFSDSYVKTTTTSSAASVGIVWRAWNDTTTIKVKMIQATDSTWSCWVQTSTGTTANTYYVREEYDSAASVWSGWCPNGSVIKVQMIPAPQLTEEQVAARARQAEEQRLAREEAERKRKEAEEKAEKLLQEHLNEEQQKEYQEQQAFHVVTASGRRYQVRRGISGNVYEIKAEQDGKVKELKKFCIHPHISVPAADNMLAQKLLLETNEAEFERVANVTQLARDAG